MDHEVRKYITPEVEKRRHRRARLVTEVRCEALGQPRIMVTRDLSPGGLFIPTNKPFATSLELSLSFRLQPGGEPIACRGRVVYSIEGLGMGIAFLDLAEAARRRLEKFVDEAR